MLHNYHDVICILMLKCDSIEIKFASITIYDLFDIGIFGFREYFSVVWTKMLMVTSKELYRSGNLKESRALWKHHSTALTQDT